MDSSELAMKMLEWEKQTRANNVLGAEIEAEVLRLGKTQVVGKCRVTYRNGTATYDYETPCKSVDPAILAQHAVTVDTVDWKAVAAEVPEVIKKHTTQSFAYSWKTVLKAANLEPLVVSRTDPTATIKLDE